MADSNDTAQESSGRPLDRTRVQLHTTDMLQCNRLELLLLVVPAPQVDSQNDELSRKVSAVWLPHVASAAWLIISSKYGGGKQLHCGIASCHNMQCAAGKKALHF